MINNPVLLTSLIFIPIVCGFVGCIYPKPFYKIGFGVLFIYAILSLKGYLNGYEYSYKLINNDGIPLSFDSYSLPLIFGSAIVIMITFILRNKYFSHYFHN